MKYLKYSKIVMFAALVTFASRTQRLIDFTIISSKNVSLNIDRTAGKEVSGKSMGFLGFGVNIKDAMDETLSNEGSEYDLLIDGVAKFKSYYFVSGYTFKGVAVSSRQMKAALGSKGFEEWA